MSEITKNIIDGQATPARVQTEKIVDLLSTFRFRTGREIDLQDGVEKVLVEAGIAFLREHRIRRGPIDFFLSGIGVECKVDGSQSEVWRQLVDYADDEAIAGLILVTSKPSHIAGLANELCGKPLGIVRAWRAL